MANRPFHTSKHTTGTTDRVVHIPHNYRHADLLHSVSGITMGGQVVAGSTLSPDRSDVMCVSWYLQLCTVSAFAVLLRCEPPFYFSARYMFPNVALAPSTTETLDLVTRGAVALECSHTNTARRSSPPTISSAQPSSPCTPSCTPLIKRALPTPSSSSASRPTTTSASRTRPLDSRRRPLLSSPSSCPSGQTGVLMIA